jgi:hypothetical protein
MNNELYRPLSGDTNVATDFSLHRYEHDEFQVNIEHSKLTKMCAIEGEMILSIIDKTIIFKDINTGCVKNRFPFSLIRRFGIYGPCFFLQVGQGFQNGAGDVFCRTPKAKQINKKCLKIIKAYKTKINENNMKNVLRRMTTWF